MKCPYCNSDAEWIPNEMVYGRRYGTSYMCYYCKPCDAYVGCHNNTREPLGTMANKELREWRHKAHLVFDPLWQKWGLKRDEAYKILDTFFKREIHIGSADIETCKKIISYIQMTYESNKGKNDNNVSTKQG